jgi:multidrug efflux pump subunit AcrA (membrane-fusion protein)
MASESRRCSNPARSLFSVRVLRNYWPLWLVVLVAACGAAWQFWGRKAAAPMHGHAPGKAATVGRSAEGRHGEMPIRTLALSDQARRNLDLRFQKLALVDYWRTLTVPAEVIEEPGHCEQRITTSLDGVVQKIYILKGQTVRPGDPLFDLKLAGGPLADVQASLLRTVQNLELVNAELARIKPLADQGTIPVRTLLEKEYERKRLESQRHTETEELLIRGLTQEQVQGIVESRTLLREFTVRVPMPPVATTLAAEDRREHSDEPVQPAALSEYTTHEHGLVYTVEQIGVVLGEMVRSGEVLCELALHTVLLIEGRAFEREASLVERALAERWPVEAHFETGEAQPLVRTGLTVLMIENSLDAAGRTLKFYLPLVNEVLLDRELAGGVSYRNWRFRPGQKVRLLLPAEFLRDRLVLPADAVVREGADVFVFRQNGRRLERVPVVIEHQDTLRVVIGRGSRLYAGDVVAVNQAYQLNLLLRQSEQASQGHSDHDHDH